MITESDIERLFGSILARIQGQDLRKKTARAWVVACQRGRWRSVEKLQGMPLTVVTHQANFATFGPPVMMERDRLIQYGGQRPRLAGLRLSRWGVPTQH